MKDALQTVRARVISLENTLEIHTNHQITKKFIALQKKIKKQ